jgi:GT2 family glycosyltransferase
MALIAMAVYDTEANERTAMTDATLESLRETVDWDRHRLIVVNNGSWDVTREHLLFYQHYFDFTEIDLDQNYGTAKAINRAWIQRQPHEICVKMDNDVVIHQAGWADLMEEVIARDPHIGICGLKRKDLEERPDHPAPFFRSKLRMLRHIPGEPWIVVEEVEHVMGTCQGYNPALLGKIGYLEQMGGLYGFDDALAAVRCRVAGFTSVFLPHIEIDHIDPGGTSYQQWKERYAGDLMGTYQQYVREYQSGQRSIYSASGWPG